MMIESLFSTANQDSARGLDRTAQNSGTKLDETAAPTTVLAGGTGSGTDDVKVTPAALQEILVDKSDEVMDKHLGKIRKGKHGRCCGEQPAPDRIAEKVLRKITKRLEQAARHLEKIEQNPKQLERRLAKVVHKLEQALNIAFRETIKALRQVAIEGEHGGRFLDEVAGPLFAGLGRLPGEINAMASASISNERSFSLEVRTQEGDTVTIQVESRTAASSSMEISRSEDSFSQQQSSGTMNAQSLSFRVEGDLNAEEAAAIQQLVDGAESLSNSFYSGDLEAAFQGAQALQFDSGELSGYSLNMQQTTQAEVIAAYSNSPVQLPGSTALDSGIRDLTAGLDLQSFFENVDALIREMITGALETHPEAEVEAS